MAGGVGSAKTPGKPRPPGGPRGESPPTPGQPQGGPLAEPPLTLGATERLPILAVDDRPENLVALEVVLAPLGLAVVTATSGEEALRLLLERDFALILLDVRMPGLDGIETARMIRTRRRNQEVPIVFLTAARDEVSDMLRGYDVGAVDYVLKPFDEELLRSKVAVFAELEHRRVALRHSEAFLRSAFEAAPIGKTLLDVQWRVVRCNAAFARLVRRSQEALAGVAIGELCDAEDREALLFLLERAAAGLEGAGGASGLKGAKGAPGPGDAGGALGLDDADGALGFDVRLVLEDGSELWVAPTASSIKSSELAAPLVLVQWVDVSARRRAEQARGDLLLEQAARAQAEVEAERLQELHAQEHRIAVELQRGLLPSRLPELPGVAIAAHSRAAGLTAEVGGDWYDAFVLPGDRLGVVIGDVTGSGIGAASAMGQLRSVTRAFALIAPAPPPAGVPASAAGAPASPAGAPASTAGVPASPAGVLERLRRYHQQVGIEELFTVLYLILDPSEGVVTWANAGHPPPILRARDGSVRLLSGGQSLMSLADVEYQDQRVTVGEGDTLVLYTDGLVERRDETIDAGLGRLRSVIADGPREAEALCSYLLESVPGAGARTGAGAVGTGATIRAEEPEDDLTALVVGLTGETDPAPHADNRIHATLERDAHAPARARKLITRSFGHRLEPEQLDQARLAVSEVITNAVLHGEGGITLLAEIDDSRLLVEVADEGSGFEYTVRERAFGEAGGRGLNIVDQVTSRWGTHEGTAHVWFEIERGRPRLGAARRTASE